jgi:glutathione-specific gamma-glutamylcyclotransferase
MHDLTSNDLWIFGYGSLMWRPGFSYAERAPARLENYHRCFCITSTHHRGSADRPGLVLGLDRGGACDGIAYRVASADAPVVRAYLRQRELINGVYRERLVPLGLSDGSHRTVRGLTYIVERAHPSYAGNNSLQRQAHLIRGARGLSGDNLDYLVNTVRSLQASGIRERDLERLVAIAAPHVAQRATLSGQDQLASPSAAAIRRIVARTPLKLRRLPKGERRRFLYRMRLSP